MGFYVKVLIYFVGFFLCLCVLIVCVYLKLPDVPSLCEEYI